EHIRIRGQVLDGEEVPINDAMIEIWQADNKGRYVNADDPASNTGFTGFGRFGTGTDAENRFIFDTVKPGSIEAGSAPHINVIVFMRGMLSHAYTRFYFSDETVANEVDPVLNAVPEERRATLIAERDEENGDVIYSIDIRMQGDRETVFFDV
ncbi:MAG: protocatechuate 3,4-dioxygenase subunit alpha, partial [Hyphomicrobiales bacterium]